MANERVIDGYIIPSGLVHPDAVVRYVEIMKKFTEKNSRAPKGILGSYCASGQEYFAYEVAMGIQRPRIIGEMPKGGLLRIVD